MTQLPMLFPQADQDAATRLRTAFLELLADGQWHRGSSLLKALGTNERVIRRMADKSAGMVISGPRGYRHIIHASTAEIDHAEARLLSQARKMTERAAQYRLARNRGGRVA